MQTSILITGGCRSGKSRYALALAENRPGKNLFLATAQPLDEEMRKRIQKHRSERGSEWFTFEEPLNPETILGKCCEDPRAFLVVDCLTLWISNLLMASRSDTAILQHARALLNRCAGFQGTVVFITNEVGAGVVPESSLGRRFRDLAGEINQLFAGHCDEVVQMVSGIPVTLKSGIHPEPAATGPQPAPAHHEFSETEKAGLYKAVYERRDVRHFKSDPIPDAVLKKILRAAHHAGSVGFMQPWNFIVVDDPEMKERVFNNFSEANQEAANNYSGSTQELYSSLKLEGICQAPVNVCVTCDRDRAGPHVLGRNTMRDTDIFSTCCAVQNLWLAARAEGLGVGWVSILSMDRLKKDLELPASVIPIAYLCLGYTESFSKIPMLEKAGWADRLPLERILFRNRWGQDFNELF